MEQQQQQLDAAVHAALSPTSTPELRSQAYVFLDQVRHNKLETWPACLRLFSSGTEDAATGTWVWTFDQQSRVFGLTVIDEVLLGSFDKLGHENVEHIRQSLLSYCRREYVRGEAERGSSYTKNKVARTVFCLFLNTYATTWPSFFADFAALVRTTPPSAPSTSTAQIMNPKATDLFLRILHEIAFEISDTQLRLNKPYDRLTKDTELRDLIRENAASGLSTMLFEILRDSLALLGQPTSGPDSRDGRADLVEHAARAIGDYVSWIDINLVITPHTIPLVLQCLQAPQTSIVAAAIEALHETVAKGMASADKLELVRVLNVVEIVHRLQGAAYDRNVDLDVEVSCRLKLARLLNTAGLELTKAATDSHVDPTGKQSAMAMAHQMLPVALRFIRDSETAISAATIPFLTSILQDLKKQKKIANQKSPNFSDTQLAFLRELMETCISKMEFDSDADWNGVPDDHETDDHAPFLENRLAMKTLFDAVAFIDEPLFSSAVRTVMTSTLETLSAAGAGTAALPWQRVELAMYLLYLYGEADRSRGSGVASMVEVPKTELDRTKRDKTFRINWNRYPYSPLGELLLMAIRSPVASHPHPAVPLQFFECIVRYHDLFTLAPDAIQSVFSAFLGARGLFHPDHPVQQRTCYLFSRFVTQGKAQIQAHCSTEMITGILEAMKTLFVIKVSLSATDAAAPDPLAKAVQSQSPFDSQIHIFESAGLLVSLLHGTPDQQVILLRALLEPLIGDVRTCIRSSVASMDDLVAILRLHHLIIAVGSICKGFPALVAKADAAQGLWPTEFVRALSNILEALGQMSAIGIIRGATMSSFKIVINTTGSAVLPLVPGLISLVLGKLNATEVVDFLPFISLLMHKYKTHFSPLLDAMVHSLFARVYFFLSQPITGSDDKYLHSELRRAYYTLITTIFTANQQDVFLSTRNQPQFESFLQSAISYISSDATVSDVRTAFGAINRMANAWIAPVNGNTNAVNPDINVPKPLPGFERFVYEKVVPLCIDLPLQKSFDYSDAQSYLTLGEMTTLFKCLYQRRGPEFLELLAALLKARQYPSVKAHELISEVAGRKDWHDLKKFYAPFAQEMRKMHLAALDANAAAA